MRLNVSVNVKWPMKLNLFFFYEKYSFPKSCSCWLVVFNGCLNLGQIDCISIVRYRWFRCGIHLMPKHRLTFSSCFFTLESTRFTFLTATWISHSFLCAHKITETIFHSYPSVAADCHQKCLHHGIQTLLYFLFQDFLALLLERNWSLL